MSKSYRDITRDVSASLAKLRVDIPDTMKGFSLLAQAALRDGALDKKNVRTCRLHFGKTVPEPSSQ